MGTGCQVLNFIVFYAENNHDHRRINKILKHIS
jgi:hypothetical protein